MTREEMIAKLQQVKFCAAPTVMTMDMGLEYDYITPEGAGTCLGRIGDWPAYKLRKINDSQWKTIQNKVKEGKVTEEDFDGTDVAEIIETLHDMYDDFYDRYYADPNVTFADVCELPAVLPDFFYCMLDVGAWGEKPKFYSDCAAFLEEFKQRYCTPITPWDEFDDSELESWLDRTEDDLATFSFYEFDSEME